MSAGVKPLVENATRDLARFAAGIRFEDIPRDAVERIKLSGPRLDRLLSVRRHVAVDAQSCRPRAGRRRAARRFVHGHGQEELGIAGGLGERHRRARVRARRYPQGIDRSRGLDRDADRTGYAEAKGRSAGRDVITAMTAGYEVGHRVGSAATQSLFFRGFHPQGTSGVFVAAATAARACSNLDAGQIQHTLGIVGSQAGGLMAAQEGAMVKRFPLRARGAERRVFGAACTNAASPASPMCSKRRMAAISAAIRTSRIRQRLTEGIGKRWETLTSATSRTRASPAYIRRSMRWPTSCARTS